MPSPSKQFKGRRKSAGVRDLTQLTVRSYLRQRLGLASVRLTGRSSESASKASHLAAEQIGKLLDPPLPEEEKRARQRGLIKGPREFRDLRKPKA
jgi:hypothetical protein